MTSKEKKGGSATVEPLGDTTPEKVSGIRNKNGQIAEHVSPNVGYLIQCIYIYYIELNQSEIGRSLRLTANAKNLEKQ